MSSDLHPASALFLRTPDDCIGSRYPGFLPSQRIGHCNTYCPTSRALHDGWHIGYFGRCMNSLAYLRLSALYLETSAIRDCYNLTPGV